MKRRPVQSWTFLLLLVLAISPTGLRAQDKVAALTQSLAANQKQLRQYMWVETTVVSMKGEEKSRVQKQCLYGPDGKIQKQQLSAPPPQQPAPGGLKGKAVANKKEEITATMKQAVALVQSYVPPDSQRIQATKAAGNLAVNPLGPDSVRLDLRNYSKSGDTFSLGLDTARNALQTISVKSYLASEKEAVTLEVTFARLRDGLSYPGTVVLSVPEEKIQVVIQNSNYQRVAPAAPAPAAAQQGAAAAKPAAASTTALDNLLAPIALYPDALVAQILEASKDFAAVQKFAAWLKTNSSLKGTELQDAAHKAGFAPCYIALAPFPQVMQMLVEKPDWTTPLGAAFTSDQAAVYQSIQRLRAAAMALGNLKTTPQQEVVTETVSSGQTVILVQPANPQVVYVPVYNTQVVYVQQAPPPSASNTAAAAMVGFTAGIIIGSSSNNYYNGPYAWRGGAAAYQPGVRAAGRLRGRSPGLRGGPPRRRPGQRRGPPGQRRGQPGSAAAGGAEQPVAAPIDRAGQSVVTAVHCADEPVDPAVDGTNQFVDTPDHSQHRERWKRGDGAGESGESPILGADESVQPAVHGAVESIQPAVHREERRWLPERRKRTDSECERKRQPWWRRRPRAIVEDGSNPVRW